MLAKLHRYVGAGQQVEMIYMDCQGKISKRRIHPYTIKGNQIKAYCLHRRAIRSFLVDQILAIFPV